MIDLGEIVSDPDFAQSFTISRSQGGSFGPGGWTEGTPASVPGYGVIQPARDRELKMVPEGDRVEGSIAIYTQQPLYVTHNDSTPGTSDIIVWHGENYRVQAVGQWEDFGYYLAIAVRITGD